MLRASLLLCILALSSLIAGLTGLAGTPFELGRLVFFVLLSVAILTFGSALVSSRGPSV